MCLITKQKEAEILKEDLTVYKRFHSENGELLPWSDDYRHLLVYKIGKTYKQPLGVNNIVGSIYDGLVYRKYKLCLPLVSNPNISEFTHIHKGFHSALTQERLGEGYSSYHVDCKCTIPKGAKVFKDETGLIVSDKIKVNKRIKLWGEIYS